MPIDLWTYHEIVVETRTDLAFSAVHIPAAALHLFHARCWSRIQMRLGVLTRAELPHWFIIVRRDRFGLFHMPGYAPADFVKFDGARHRGRTGET